MLLLSWGVSLVGVTNYYFLGDLFGYSILTDVIFIYHFIYARKYCEFTRFSVFGLLAMSIVSLLNPLLDYATYSYIYDTIILSIVIFLGIIYTIRR